MKNTFTPENVICSGIRYQYKNVNMELHSYSNRKPSLDLSSVDTKLTFEGFSGQQIPTNSRRKHTLFSVRVLFALIFGELIIKRASSVGIEPTTSRLTVERANRLRHED